MVYASSLQGDMEEASTSYSGVFFFFDFFQCFSEKSTHKSAFLFCHLGRVNAVFGDDDADVAHTPPAVGPKIALELFLHFIRPIWKDFRNFFCFGHLDDLLVILSIPSRVSVCSIKGERERQFISIPSNTLFNTLLITSNTLS